TRRATSCNDLSGRMDSRNNPGQEGSWTSIQEVKRPHADLDGDVAILAVAPDLQDQVAAGLQLADQRHGSSYISRALAGHRHQNVVTLEAGFLGRTVLDDLSHAQLLRLLVHADRVAQPAGQ